MVSMEEQAEHAELAAAAHDAKDAAVTPPGKPIVKHASPAAACQAAGALIEDTPGELDLDSSLSQIMQERLQAEQPGARTAAAHAEQAPEGPEQHACVETQADGSGAFAASKSMQLLANTAPVVAAASIDSTMHQAVELQGGSGIQHSAAASEPQDLFASFAVFQDLSQPDAEGADCKKRKRDGDVV
jgi:hypothetical protein